MFIFFQTFTAQNEASLLFVGQLYFVSLTSPAFQRILADDTAGKFTYWCIYVSPVVLAAVRSKVVVPMF